MGPTQFSPHCGDNLPIGEGLGEAKHVAQALGRIAAAEIGLKAFVQADDDLLTVGGAFVARHVAADALVEELRVMSTWTLRKAC